MEINMVPEKQISFLMKRFLLFFVMALLFWADVACAEADAEKQKWLERVNAHLAVTGLITGCEFPRTQELQITREQHEIRGGAPLSPMERKFSIPSSDDQANYEAYKALLAGGFIENNSELTEIKSEMRKTFSLTMKGWQAFPLNRGGQQTCIHWIAHEQAKSVQQVQSYPNGMAMITYESIFLNVPDWLPQRIKIRYRGGSTNRVTLPDLPTSKLKQFYAERFGELASPEQIRSRFPSDDKVIEMAQQLLNRNVKYSGAPCVPMDTSAIESKNPVSKQPGPLTEFYFSQSINSRHLRLLRALVQSGYLEELQASLEIRKGPATYAFRITPKYIDELGPVLMTTCLRYGTAVPKKVVATPDGQPSYIQYFVVWYVIEDLEPWVRAPGVFENLPESARLCIKWGSLIEVQDAGNGSMVGCSLP
jgi:hypothetical protein